MASSKGATVVTPIVITLAARIRGQLVSAYAFAYNDAMQKKEFRSLKVAARLRYLADLRGVPKDAIAVVEHTGLTDDGEGNGVEGLCRIRVIEVPEGFKKMPFLAHLVTIFESDADLFEHTAQSTRV